MKKQLLSLTISALMLTGCAGKSSSSSVSEIVPVTAGTKTVSGEPETSSKPNETVTVTIASIDQMNDDIANAISAFNAEDNGYYIDVKYYYLDRSAADRETSIKNGIAADFKFLQDMINTDDIDIVYSNSYVNASSYESLKNKGAFADLYPFMENDSEVNSAALNSHILELNETDGKLYSFPTYYGINTMIGKTKYVGDKENWTTDEFFEHWNNAPAGMNVSDSPYAEGVYRTVLWDIEDFVDYDKGEVDFDSDDFRRLLEFCGSFPSNNNEKYEEIDWNKVFIMRFGIDSMLSAGVFNKDYVHYLLGEKDKYTLVGNPRADGNGAYFADIGLRFSICSNSSAEKQRGAWEFIRSFYTYDYQKENAIIFAKDVMGNEVISSEKGLCINKKAFDEVGREIVSGKYYADLNKSLNEEWQKYQIPTEDSFKKFCQYIERVNRWIPRRDVELISIVDEEVFAYLADGQSLDRTIDIIQDRASIWMSERA